jgi:hypothetical protein
MAILILLVLVLLTFWATPRALRRTRRYRADRTARAQTDLTCELVRLQAIYQETMSVVRAPAPGRHRASRTFTPYTGVKPLRLRELISR